MPELKRVVGRWLVLAVFWAASWGACDAALARDLKVETGVDFSTGKYGTDNTTSVVNVPLRLRYRDGPYKLRLGIPFLIVQGPEQAVPNIGVVGTSNGASTVAGLGDIRFSGSVRVLGGGTDDRLRAELTTGAKTPSGSRARGLGSGAWRLFGAVETTLDITRNVWVENNLGWSAPLASNDSLQLREFVYFSSTLNVDLNDRWTVGATLDTQQRAVSGGSTVLEVGVFAEYEIVRDTRVSVSAFRGLTRDSSDWGAGIVVSRTFRF
jgi:hypothetical protein